MEVMRPATGDRLTCTSKIERNTLIRRPGLLSRDSSSTSMIRPSAGETIESGSGGGVLSGSRKKNRTKSARKISTLPSQFQFNTTATIPMSSGAAANLYPSLIMHVLVRRKNGDTPGASTNILSQFGDVPES